MIPDDDVIPILDAKLAELMEHFESVQIMVSWPDEKSRGTRSAYRGQGNWFARQGMAHDFIAMDQAETAAREVGRVINPPESGA